MRLTSIYNRAKKLIKRNSSANEHKDKDVLKTFAKYAFIIWVASIAVFLIESWLFKPESGIYSPAQGLIFLLTASIGVIAFLVLSVSFLLLLIRKVRSFRLPVQVAVALLLLMFTGSAFAAIRTVVNTAPLQPQIPLIEDIEIDAPTPFPEQQSNNAIAQPEQNSGLTQCRIHANCGGGALDVPANACSNIICCEIGERWVLYMDKAQCEIDQNTYWRNYYDTGNRPVNTPIPIPTFSFDIPDFTTPTSAPQPPTQPSTPNYVALLQECRNAATAEYNATMNNLRARGMSNSSEAELAEQRYYSRLQQCANWYGN